MKYTQKDLKAFEDLIKAARQIVILQPEHVDADSLGSALGLEQLLEDQGKQVTMYCYDSVPGYLHHLLGWDRVTSELPNKYDVAILVDSATKSQLEKTFSSYRQRLTAKPFIIIDHHDSANNLIDFATLKLIDPQAGASSQQVVELAKHYGWKLHPDSGYALASGIKADTVNLATLKTTAGTFRAMAALAEVGVDFAQLRQNSEAAQAIPIEHLPHRIAALSRAKFYHNSEIALTYFTREEYESLEDTGVIDKIKNELRMLKGVVISVTVTERKGYANASMRADIPVARQAAEKFGGGGHDAAASCRFINGTHETVIEQFIPALEKIIDEYHAQAD